MIATAISKNHRLFSVPSLRRRLACLLYESVLLFGVLFTTSYFFSVITQTRHALANRHAQQAVLFIALGLYFVWSWRKGYTLAMKTWRIQIISNKRSGPDLNRISWQQAIVRFLLAWVWVMPSLLLYVLYTFFFRQSNALQTGTLLSLGFGWILFWALLSKLHPSKQFWHDTLAQTRLVDYQPDHSK